LYCLYQTGNNTFHSSNGKPVWTQLGSTTVGDNISTGRMGYYGNGQLQVVANRLSDNAVLSFYQSTSGASNSWSGPVNLNCPLDGGYGLVVGKNQNGVLQIFATSSQTGPTDNNIVTCYQATSTAWSSWSYVSGTGTYYAGPNLTCGLNTNGTLEIFFWGYKGMLDHLYQNSANSYTSWSGGDTFLGDGSGNIGVINNASTTWNLSLFVFNLSYGTVFSKFQDMSPQGYAGWSTPMTWIN